MINRPSPWDDASTLRLLLEGTVAETGTEFFRALVRNLSEALNTTGAWVTEYDAAAGKLRALAMWLDGRYVEHYEYTIKDTPCAAVVEQRSLVRIPEKVIELYPGDNDLKPLHAVSYLGAPLLDTEGEVLGHLSVLDTKPLPEDPRMVSVFEIFAARAAAEHRRLKIEQELRRREESLSLLLQSALDGIVVLGRDLAIERVNPAAERLFGCRAEDLLGERLEDFLSAESAARVEALTRELEGRPPDRQHLWLPQDLTVRRWDHSVFPAEATLSRFVSRHQTYHTLILRNADERVQAERQIRLLTQETEYLREAVREMPGLGDLLGRSAPMQAVFDAIQRVAPTDSTVLITGETGTGKELVARSVHRASPRADQPLVLVNCAAIPANLIESELFGHERGAFTGAVTRREGRFALAHRGTLFLDEVGELPLELQAKLLRVLQEGEFEPLGGTRTTKVDVRVIAATHRDLRRMVADRKFRDDLYFRLHVFPIHLPPLRERGRDVEQLAGIFLERFARRMGKRLAPLTAAQLQRLHEHDWPGNVRELQNVIERAIILASDSQLELDRALSGVIGNVPVSGAPVSGATPESPSAAARVLTARELEEFERANLVRALTACGGKVSGEGGAARLLGIPPTTLASRLKVLGLVRGRQGASD